MRVFLTILLLGVALTGAFELKYDNVNVTNDADADNDVAVPKLQPRVINGIRAAMGQFKYQVGLYIKKGQYTSSCGGSLIGSNWILTAAHCITGATTVYAFMGSTTFLSGTIVAVSQGILHGGWNPQTSANDICLLRIPSISFGDNIAPVILPPLYGSGDSYVNNEVIVSGWGTTSDRNMNPAESLLYARLRIVPNSVCLRSYGSTLFRDTNMCAQGLSGTSACKGDSGGPIVTTSGILVGITSYGAAAGCTLGYPGAYTRVSSYRSWINYYTGI